MLALTVWVTLVTLPLIWVYFGELPLLSVPGNLLVVPLVTGYLYLTGIALLLSPLVVFTPLLALAMKLYYALIALVTGALSHLPGIVLSVGYPHAAWFLVPSAVLFLVYPLTAAGRKRRILFAACSLTVVFLVSVFCLRIASRDSVSFTYLNEGTNDSFVLVSENRALLGDLSDGGSSSLYRMTEEMRRLHVCEADAFLLTHYHKKHIQLFGKLCEREIVRKLLLPAPETDAEREILESLLETAERAGVEVVPIPAEEAFDFRGISVRVFPRKLLSRSTHPIAGLAVGMPEGKLVLASASFSEGAESLAEAAYGADILVLGAHSPIYKKTFRLPSPEGPKVLVLSDIAREYLENPEDFPDAVHADGTPLRITERRSGAGSRGQEAAAAP